MNTRGRILGIHQNYYKYICIIPTLKKDSVKYLKSGIVNKVYHSNYISITFLGNGFVPRYNNFIVKLMPIFPIHL